MVDVHGLHSEVLLVSACVAALDLQVHLRGGDSRDFLRQQSQAVAGRAPQQFLRQAAELQLLGGEAADVDVHCEIHGFLGLTKRKLVRHVVAERRGFRGLCGKQARRNLGFLRTELYGKSCVIRGQRF